MESVHAPGRLALRDARRVSRPDIEAHTSDSPTDAGGLPEPRPRGWSQSVTRARDRERRCSGFPHVASHAAQGRWPMVSERGGR